MVTKVLRNDAKDKFKFDVAMSYCRRKMTTFRSDEKRKVNVAFNIFFCKKGIIFSYTDSQ